MAGNYPDQPSRRMGWDGDGTIGLYTANGAINYCQGWTEMSGVEKAEANDEDETTVLSGAGGGNFKRFGFIFPELREFDGYFYRQRLSALTLETSADTTNGCDGTWGSLTSVTGTATLVRPDYRSDIVSAASSAIRGIRFHSTSGGGGFAFTALHLYGEISPGETPDRLLFIDEATGLEFTKPRDYGNVPRGSSEDVQWRIRNNSASLTANTIQYTTEELYLDAGGDFTHTLPGGASFQATQQVTSLAPATTSGIITTRRISDGATPLGLRSGRTYLNVSSWS